MIITFLNHNPAFLSFQVGLHDFNQLFGTLRPRGRVRCAHNVFLNMVFHDLCHEAVDSASNRGDEPQNISALGFGFQCALDSFDLAADAPNPGDQLCFFADRVCHDSYSIGEYLSITTDRVPLVQRYVHIAASPTRTHQP